MGDLADKYGRRGGVGGGSAERSPILSLYYIRVMDMYSSLKWGDKGTREKKKYGK